jgi:hypothetical protein
VRFYSRKDLSPKRSECPDSEVRQSSRHLRCEIRNQRDTATHDSCGFGFEDKLAPKLICNFKSTALASLSWRMSFSENRYPVFPGHAPVAVAVERFQPARLPRCCREIALGRAESSDVVTAARRQGVNNTRKIRWLGRSGVVPLRRHCLASSGMIPYPVGAEFRASLCSFEDIPATISGRSEITIRGGQVG